MLYLSLECPSLHYTRRKGESILHNAKQSHLYKYRKARPALLFLTFFAWIAYAVCAIVFGFTPWFVKLLRFIALLLSFLLFFYIKKHLQYKKARKKRVSIKNNFSYTHSTTHRQMKNSHFSMK